MSTILIDWHKLPSTECVKLLKEIEQILKQSILRASKQSSKRQPLVDNVQIFGQSIEQTTFVTLEIVLDLLRQCTDEYLSIKKSFDQLAEQSIDQSTNGHNIEGTDQSINHLITLNPNVRLFIRDYLVRLIDQITSLDYLIDSLLDCSIECELIADIIEQSIKLIGLHLKLTSINQSGYQSINQKFVRPTPQQFRERIKPPIPPSINQSINQSDTNDLSSTQPMDNTNNQSINQSNNQSEKSAIFSQTEPIKQSVSQSINQSLGGHRTSAPDTTFSDFLPLLFELNDTSTDNVIDQSISESSNQTISQSISQLLSLDPPMFDCLEILLDPNTTFYQSINHSSIPRPRSTIRDSNQSKDQLINQSINQSIDQQRTWLRSLSLPQVVDVNVRGRWRTGELRLNDLSQMSDQPNDSSVDQSINQSISHLSIALFGPSPCEGVTHTEIIYPVVDQSASDSFDERYNLSIDPSTSQSLHQLVDRSVQHSMHQSINMMSLAPLFSQSKLPLSHEQQWRYQLGPTNEPTEEPTDEPINQSNNQSINQSAIQSYDQPHPQTNDVRNINSVSQTQNESVERPADQQSLTHITENHVIEPVDNSNNQSTQSITHSTISHLDVLDTVNKWYSATIQPSNIPMIDRLDSSSNDSFSGEWVHVSFDGWTEKYDEYISIYSERLDYSFIQSFNLLNNQEGDISIQRSKGGKESGGAPASLGENVDLLEQLYNRSINHTIDNSNQQSVEQAINHPFDRSIRQSIECIAEWRSRVSGCWRFIESVNIFHNVDGFDLIAKRLLYRFNQSIQHSIPSNNQSINHNERSINLSVTQSSLSLTQMKTLLSVVMNVAPYLKHRPIKQWTNQLTSQSIDPPITHSQDVPVKQMITASFDLSSNQSTINQSDTITYCPDQPLSPSSGHSHCQETDISENSPLDQSVYYQHCNFFRYLFLSTLLDLTDIELRMLGQPIIDDIVSCLKGITTDELINRSININRMVGRLTERSIHELKGRVHTLMNQPTDHINSEFLSSQESILSRIDMINQRIRQLSNQLTELRPFMISPSLNQSIIQSSMQPINLSTNQPVGQSIKQVVDQSINISAQLEQFILAISIKRINSTLIERRINGMTTMQDYVLAINQSMNQKKYQPLHFNNHSNNHLNNQSMSQSSEPWLTPAQVVVFINQAKLIESIFNQSVNQSTGQAELIKRSTDVLKFLANQPAVEQSFHLTSNQLINLTQSTSNQSALTNYHLSLIWQCLLSTMKRSDELMLAALYKVLEDVAYVLNHQSVNQHSYSWGNHKTPASVSQGNQSIHFLLSCVEEIPLIEYSSQTIELINQLIKWSSPQPFSQSASQTNNHTIGQLVNATPAKRAMRILWDVHCSPLISRDLSNQSIKVIEEIISQLINQSTNHQANNDPNNQALEYVELYATMLCQRQYPLSCIRLLTQLIEAFPVDPSTIRSSNRHTISTTNSQAVTYSRAQVLVYLNDQFGILQSSLDDLYAVKQQAKDLVNASYNQSSQMTSNLSINQLILPDSHSPYSAHIRDRLQWLHFILSNAQTDSSMIQPHEEPTNRSTDLSINSTNNQPDNSLGNRSISLSISQIDELWNACHLNAQSINEQESFDRWLKQCINQPSNQASNQSSYQSTYSYPISQSRKQTRKQPIFDERMIAHIFCSLLLPSIEQSFSSSDSQSAASRALNQAITLPHWLAFESYFFAINQSAKRLIGSSVDDVCVIIDQPLDCSVQSDDQSNNQEDSRSIRLMGISTVWRVAIECRNVDVSNRAINQLIALHENIQSIDQSVNQSIDNRRAVRCQYIQMCWQYLIKFIQSVQQNHQSNDQTTTQTLTPTTDFPVNAFQRAVCCITLLHSLIDASDRSFSQQINPSISQFVRYRRSHSQQARGRPIKLTINNQIKFKRLISPQMQSHSRSVNQPLTRFDLVVHANDSLSSLAQRIADAIDQSVDQLKLTMNGIDLVERAFSQSVIQSRNQHSTQSNNQVINISLNHPINQSISLENVGITNRKTITVTKRSFTQLAHQPANQSARLLDQNEDVTPMFRSALSQMFNQFAIQPVNQSNGQDPYMSSQSMVNYILACQAGEESANIKRIEQILNNYGTTIVCEASDPPNEHSNNQPRDQSINPPINRFRNQPIDRRLTRSQSNQSNLSINRSLNQSVDDDDLDSSSWLADEDDYDQPIDQSSNQSIGQSVDDATWWGNVQHQIQQIQANQPNAQMNDQSLNQPFVQSCLRLSQNELIAVQQDLDRLLKQEVADQVDMVPRACLFELRKYLSDLVDQKDHYLTTDLQMPEIHPELCFRGLRQLVEATAEDQSLIFPVKPISSQICAMGSCHLVFRLLESWMQQMEVDDDTDEQSTNQSTDRSTKQSTDSRPTTSPVSYPSLDSMGSATTSELITPSPPVASSPVPIHLSANQSIDQSTGEFQQSQNILSLLKPVSSQPMGPTDMLTNSTVNQSDIPTNNQPTSPRMIRILTLDGFIAFYRDACSDRFDNVWSDLKVHGFDQNLMRDDLLINSSHNQANNQRIMPALIDRAHRVEAALPRNILCDDAKYFDALFDTLKIDEKRLNQPHNNLSDLRDLYELKCLVWRLIQRLPSRPDMLSDIARLEPSADSSPPRWQRWLSADSMFELLYACQCVEALTEPVFYIEHDNDHSRAKWQKPDTLSSMVDKSHWGPAFLEQGGFQMLYRLFEQHANRSASQSNNQSAESHHYSTVTRHFVQITSSALLNIILVFVRTSHTVMCIEAQRVAIEQAVQVSKSVPKLVVNQHVDNSIDQPTTVPAVVSSPESSSHIRTINDENKPPCDDENHVAPAAGDSNTIQKVTTDQPEIDQSLDEKVPVLSESSSPSSCDDDYPHVDAPEPGSSEYIFSLPILAYKLSVKSASALLSSIEVGIMDTLWRLLLDCSHQSFVHLQDPSAPPINMSDVFIIQHALNIMACLIEYQPFKFLPEFYRLIQPDANPSNEQSIKKSAKQPINQFFYILYSSSSNLRKLFTHTLVRICHSTTQSITQWNRDPSHTYIPLPVPFLLGFLHQFFPDQSISAALSMTGALECDEYFVLLNNLIHLAFNPNNYTSTVVQPNDQTLDGNETTSGLTAILDSLCGRLYNYQSSESLIVVKTNQSITQAVNQSTNLGTQDKVLCGILSLVQSILHTCPNFRTMVGTGGSASHSVDAVLPPLHHRLVEVIFTDFLYKSSTEIINQSNPHFFVIQSLPKCKSQSSRGLAHALLRTLISGSAANVSMLMQLINDQYVHFNSLVGMFDFNVEKFANQSTTQSTNLVGLRNLGSTCYMNSLLQLLYSVEKFRTGVWLASPECPVRRKLLHSGANDGHIVPLTQSPRQVDDLLVQMQLMFCYLNQSISQFYDPVGFVRSYKDERGQPINPRIQQDAQEFFNVLLDRLEKALGQTNNQSSEPPTDASTIDCSSLVQHLFRGSLINQLICHTCKQVRERSEDFYSISLNVSRKGSTMLESLEQFVQGETLNDFNCSNCGKKTDITKRVCLSDQATEPVTNDGSSIPSKSKSSGSLPETLIFHLKRFELNYETFQHEKINSRFAFPFTVDLFPFTKAGLEEKERATRHTNSDSNLPTVEPSIDPVTERSSCIYDCVGILVHTGTASGGHYYSFIQDRTTQNWWEFNDQSIKPFDLVNQIDEQCYGGDIENLPTIGPSVWGTDSSAQEKVKNAYMLIYQRRVELPSDTRMTPSPNPTVSEVSLNESSASVNKDVELQSDSNRLFHSLLNRPPPSNSLIPVSMLREVEHDNQQLLVDRFVLSNPFFQLLIDFMEQISSTSISDTTGTAPMQPCFTSLTPEQLQEITADLSLSSIDLALARMPNPSINCADLRTIKLLCICGFNGIARLVDNKPFALYCHRLTFLITRNMPACQWLLLHLISNNPLSSRSFATSGAHFMSHTVADLLLACRDLHVRQPMVEFLDHVLRILAPLEQGALFDYEEESISNSRRPSTVSARFIDYLMCLWWDLPRHWLRFQQYFELLYRISSMSTMHRRYLIERHHLISLAGDLFLGEYSPISNTVIELAHSTISPAEKRSRRAAMGNAVVSPDWSHCLILFSMLARSSLNDSLAPAVESHPAYPRGCSPYFALRYDEHITLSRTDLVLIRCKQLYQQSLFLNQGVHAIGALAVHWCWRNLAITDAIAELTMSAYSHSEYDHSSTTLLTDHSYLTMIEYLMMMDDELRYHRIKLLWNGKHGLIHLMLRNNTSFYSPAHTRRIYSIVCMILRIHAAHHVPVDEVLIDTRPEWIWIDNWLRSHTQPKLSNNPTMQQRDEERFQTWHAYITMLNHLSLPVDLPPVHPSINSRSSSFSPSHFSRSRRRRDDSLIRINQTIEQLNHQPADQSYTPSDSDIDTGMLSGDDDNALFADSDEDQPLRGSSSTPRQRPRRHNSVPPGSPHRSINQSNKQTINQSSLADDDIPDLYTQPPDLINDLPVGDNKEWECKACTFLNPAHMRSCDMCESAR